MKTSAAPNFKIKLETTVKKLPTVAVAIVTWNNSEEIRDCLTGLENLPPGWQIFVVDNHSSDQTGAIVRDEIPFVKLIENTDNRGFAVANNQVIMETSTDYVLVLNPDTVADPEKLLRAVQIIEKDPKIGLLGVRLLNEDGTLQTSCFHFPSLRKNLIDSLSLHRFYSREKIAEMFSGNFFDHAKEREVDWLMGAFMLVRREAIEQAGGIPEDYFMFAEDLDWCWQIRQSGFKVLFSPEVSIKHKSNKSAGQLPSMWRVERTVLSKYLFCFKNFGAVKTRLIQITDLAGTSYKILRARPEKLRKNELDQWKISRRVILRSIFMSRRNIRSKLTER